MPTFTAQIPTAFDEESVRIWMNQGPHHVINAQDPDYPKALHHLVSPPHHLYLKGDRSLLGKPMLAIVGSRHATPQGLIDATAFARSLSRSGLTIISGLAYGIDAAAHQGALEGKGSTVAVMATGIDRLYPPAHAGLAQQIVAQGLILTEFDFGTPAKPWHFPHRNRLIAGLSLGCLVIEASLDSGSLITAQLALEQGKEVFAVPGSIHSPLSKGCHKLIREGAKLVETAQDILEELGQLIPSTQVVSEHSLLTTNLIDPAAGIQFPSEEGRFLWQNMGDKPVTLDQLSKQSNLTMSQVSLMLASLELAGLVVWLGGRVQRLVRHTPLIHG